MQERKYAAVKNRPFTKIITVFIRFSALGAYLIFEPSGWAFIRGGRLFEVGRLLNFQYFS